MQVYWVTLQGIDPSSLALHTVLEAAVANPGFLKDGAILAFACQHRYPHENDTFLRTDIKLQLKGADACLMTSARNLGLSADVQPRFALDPPDYPDSDSESSEGAGETEYFKEGFGLHVEEWPHDDHECDDYKAIKPRMVKRRGLIWCHHVKRDCEELTQVYWYYGERLLV